MGMKSQLLYTGNEFMADLSNIVIWLVSIAGALMTLYAVYIGYLFATASDEGKRKTAKSRLIKLISTIFIVYALAATLNVIKVTFTTLEKSKEEDTINTDWTTVEYAYSGNPEFKVNTKNDPWNTDFVLDPQCIKLDGVEGGYLSGAKITGFQFVGEAVYGLDQLKERMYFTQKGDGTFQVVFCCKADRDISEDIQIVCEERNFGGGSGWIYGELTFDYNDMKGLTTRVKILINRTGGKIKLVD